MPVTKPYKRICRPRLGAASMHGRLEYVTHPGYANAPDLYVRAFLLIQKDLQELFDYIEPSDKNLESYSFRLHALLVRSAVEVEANFRAILRENRYAGTARNWKMDADYFRIQASHHLASYEVKIPYWRGATNIRRPFQPWATTAYAPLPWYQAYNASKHDRHESFEEATLDNALDAVCGLLVILSAQFAFEDFSPRDSRMVASSPGDGFDEAIGEHFRIRFPNDWTDDERYAFHWPQLEHADPYPFQDYPY